MSSGSVELTKIGQRDRCQTLTAISMTKKEVARKHCVSNVDVSGKTLGCQLILSLPRVINFKFLLQYHQKYYITQYGEFGFSKLTQMKDDYTTNSHYITFLFRKVGRMHSFNLGGQWTIECRARKKDNSSSER